MDIKAELEALRTEVAQDMASQAAEDAALAESVWLDIVSFGSIEPMGFQARALAARLESIHFVTPAVVHPSPTKRSLWRRIFNK